MTGSKLECGDIAYFAYPTFGGGWVPYAGTISFLGTEGGIIFSCGERRNRADVFVTQAECEEYIAKQLHQPSGVQR
jgi:hypothetical protein